MFTSAFVGSVASLSWLPQLFEHGLTEFNCESTKLAGAGVFHSKADLDRAGMNTSALAGGEFKPLPLQSHSATLGLLWGVASGYFDVYSDITVTVGWFRDSETVLAWLSVGAISLSVLVQWALVDKTFWRRLLTLSQLKVLVDAFSSLRAGSVVPGYATAKFSEAVYEATSEGILQIFKAVKDYHNGEAVDTFLLVSIFSSVNTVALVLLMYLEQGVVPKQSQLCERVVRKCGLHLYHTSEILLRIFTLALLGFGLGRLSFVVGILCLFVRAVVLVGFQRHGGHGDWSLGLVLTVFFVDSVCNDRRSFRILSVMTVIESAVFVWFATSHGNTDHRLGVGHARVAWVLAGACVALKFATHCVVMEGYGRFSARYIDQAKGKVQLHAGSADNQAADAAEAAEMASESSVAPVIARGMAAAV